MAHRVELVHYANRIVGDVGRAEDVVQEAYLRFNTASQDQSIEKPIGYLYRIVRNLALDGLRRRRFEYRHFVEGREEGAAQIPSDAPTPEMTAVSREELRLVLDALEKMPERMRIAIEMHRFGGAKLREIAVVLDVSITVAHELVAEGVRRCRISLRHPS